MSDIEIDHGNRFLTAENDGADMGIVMRGKQLRMSYRLDTKVQVIQSVTANKARGYKGRATAITSAETGISIRVITSWLKSADKILDLYKTHNDAARKIGPVGRKIKYARPEEALTNWVKEKRSRGYPVSNLVIALKAQKDFPDAYVLINN
jgi:hypothetical protein